MKTRTKYLLGNWKMHKTSKEVHSFFSEVASKKIHTTSSWVVGVAIPSLYVASALKYDDKFKILVQNIYHKEAGAFTGEISAKMIAELGVKYCLVGHSERRSYFGETDTTVNHKLKLLLQNQVTPILCIGENEDQYKLNETNFVIRDQLKNALDDISLKDAAKIVIAYEPVWAIGTGKVATPEIANNVAELIRKKLATLYNQELADQTSILYGGSVKPDNINQICAQNNIDGVLVGGASLDSASFAQLFENK